MTNTQLMLATINVYLIAVLSMCRPSHESHLYLCTCIIETRQGVQRSSLGIEPDDVLHDFWILAPIQGLQIVGGHDIYLLLSGYTGKEHDLLCVAGFQQSFHSLKCVIHTVKILE